MITELIKRQDAINAVSKSYMYETDRMNALQEVPIVTEQEIRNKAIEEFLTEICKKYTAEEAQGNYQHFCVKIKNDIAKIAESMKGEKE